jgi:hypothetical protein
MEGEKHAKAEEKMVFSTEEIMDLSNEYVNDDSDLFSNGGGNIFENEDNKQSENAISESISLSSTPQSKIVPGLEISPHNSSPVPNSSRFHRVFGWIKRRFSYNHPP